MSQIALSAGVRNSLSAIQASSTQAQIQQTRLATGKKVNSALDNPASFFTSAGLNNRASDLSSLLDSIGQGVKTIEAADKGIKALTKLIETAQGNARQALQSASLNLKSTGSALVGGAAKTAAAGDAGNLVISIDGSTTGRTFAVAATDTVQDLVDSINDADVGIKASVGADNKLTIEATGGESLSIDASTTDATATFLGLTEGAVTRATNNTTREQLAASFDDLRTQIDQLAADAGYNGVNLLNGDNLKIQFNEGNTSSITLRGATLDSNGLGVRAALNDFQGDSDIQDALAELDLAKTQLRAQASTFGANLSVVQNRQDFTKGLIDTLESGADQLVIADASEEGAKLLALNTRQQLSTTALTLANQADQSVLRLF
jgi:flagellin-like hook-associated protein FlgL